MYKKVEKPKDNKTTGSKQESRAVANSDAQGKGKVEQGNMFVDNRTETSQLFRAMQKVSSVFGNNKTIQLAKWKWDITRTWRPVDHNEWGTRPTFNPGGSNLGEIYDTDTSSWDVVEEEVEIEYSFNDSSTWDMSDTIATENGVPLDTALTENDDVYKQALLDGLLTNNSTVGGAAVGTKYHAHANGGTGGIAFFYRRVGDTGRKVEAVIYDYAIRRTGQSGNIYNWIKSGIKSNTAP